MGMEGLSSTGRGAARACRYASFCSAGVTRGRGWASAAPLDASTAASTTASTAAQQAASIRLVVLVGGDCLAIARLVGVRDKTEEPDAGVLGLPKARMGARQGEV